MKWRRCTCVLTIGLLLTATCSGFDLFGCLRDRCGCWPRFCLHGCPDDYRPKREPCVTCPMPGCCPDDYCRKCEPTVCIPGRCCGPDDYCPKSCPTVCWSKPCELYKCPLPHGCGCDRCGGKDSTSNVVTKTPADSVQQPRITEAKMATRRHVERTAVIPRAQLRAEN
jgi:hypothetical protein